MHRLGRGYHHVAISLAISAAYLFGLPEVLKYFWGDLLKFFGGERGLFGYGTTCLHLTQVLIGNLGLVVLYWGNWSVVEQFKINKHKPWPWRSHDAEERARFWSSVRWGLATVLFNNLVVAIPSSFSTYDLMRPLGGFSASLEDWPSPLTLVWQIAVCAVLEDVAFYWGHRFLHNKRLYPYIHKWHHQFYHSIGLASENAHPLEFFASNLVPVMLGPMLLRVHIVTVWMWLWVRISETIDAHSGYEFPWSPARLTPYSSTAAHHDYHHSHNKGCFGSQFLFWDWLCGTDKDFESFVAKEEAASKSKKIDNDDKGNEEPAAGPVSASPSEGSDGGRRRSPRRA